MKFTQPTDFTERFPKYVYRSGKGKESVQWREAALDMANDRAKLVEALSKARDDLRAACQHDAADRLGYVLREMGAE